MSRTSTEDVPLNSEEFARYREQGFVLLPECLSASEVARLTAAVPDIIGAAGPRAVLERDGRTVRSVYGPHLTHDVVERLARLPRVLGAVRQILGDEVYVHQSKINIKAPFTGDIWEWHQDYVYWLRDDGIQEPALVNVMVFLDSVTEFNGPLTFVPRSHDRGVLAVAEMAGMPAGYEDAPAWVGTLTAKEKYGVRHDVIAALVRESGMASVKGGPGSVVFFHPNILHASAPNISPFGRATLILVYNVVANPPTEVATPRPDFLAARVIAPLTPLT